MVINHELQHIISNTSGTRSVKHLFQKRLKEGLYTRDENPSSHFCVYFAGYDSESKKVFIGHHKKSGLWLFNGGHIDKDEQVITSLQREISEEWGSQIINLKSPIPSLLTITSIENPHKQPCKTHYDIWFFIPLSMHAFSPQPHLMEREFFKWGWKSVAEAKLLIRNKETAYALQRIRLLFH